MVERTVCNLCLKFFVRVQERFDFFGIVKMRFAQAFYAIDKHHMELPAMPIRIHWETPDIHHSVIVILG